MESKAISIIIPVYNAERYIEKTINSILNQSFKDIEIVIVNDGSTDNSHNICADYAVKDSRIKYFKRENKGVSAARNYGIDAAKGDWIAFVDADDYIDKDTLKRVYDVIKEDNADVVIFGYVKEKINAKLTSDFKFTDNVMDYSERNFYCELLFNNKVKGFSWNKVYKKEILDSKNIRFDKDVYINEDLLFNVQYFQYVEKIRYIDSGVYHYVTTPEAATVSALNEKHLTSFIAYEKMLEMSKNKEDKELIRLSFIGMLIYMGKRIIKKGCSSYKIFADIKKELKKQIDLYDDRLTLKKFGWSLFLIYTPVLKVCYYINNIRSR